MNEPQEQLKLLNGLADDMPIELNAGQLRTLLSTARVEGRKSAIKEVIGFCKRSASLDYDVFISFLETTYNLITEDTNAD